MENVTTNFDLNMPIWHLNVGQLMELLNLQPTVVVDNTSSSGKRLEYGYGGIQRIFNCSNTTAWKIKKSGVIDKAITQWGRQIVIDIDLALELGSIYVKKNKPIKQIP